MEPHFNTRILVIDDDENVRNSFREILCPENEVGAEIAAMAKAENTLFDTGGGTFPHRAVKRSSATFTFEYDEAANGRQGYEMAEQAVAAGHPYAAVFVDMRMPGWDGLETVQHLRRIDTRAEVIFVTAYSDRSIEEIVNAVGVNVSYHCKPFSVEEIEQIATKAVYEWNKTRNLEELIETIAKLRGQQWEMRTLLNNILLQVAYLLGTHSALVAMKKNRHYEKILAIGNLCEEQVAEKYLRHVPENMTGEVYQDDDFAYFMINEFGILAIFEKGGRPLNNERIYLVRLFLEQAATAIRNVDLQDALIRGEKLSAVGEAAGMIVHDLKNSIGSIDMAIEAMKPRLDDKDFIISMLDTIGTAAREGMAIVTDILDFLGNRKTVPAVVDATALFSKVAAAAALPLDRARVELQVECPPDIKLFGDAEKLGRALSNLIKNAIESFTDRNIANPEIRLSLTADDKNCHIAVADNGPGLPLSVSEKIFTPFVTSGKKGGTGLGLPIVKQIVDAQGGVITVDTSPQGTVFNITLPRAAQ